MGRTSKFSFPLPARTYSTTPKEKEATNKPSPWRGSTLSKAQRILGAESDLNIDSQLRDDDQSWVYPGSRSSGISGMSICISESSQSTRSKDDTASISQSHSDQWELESGVFPRPQGLRGKASSTLLGQNYGEDGGATDTSSIGRRMHREHSDSTLRSYYDRQKSPLAISQQTSASSARDLALRKGCPPVVTRSPLLQIESVEIPDEHLVYPDHEDFFRDKSKKKPSRLDLSMLIPRSRRNGGGEDSGPPTPYSTNGSNTPHSQDSSSFRRRLTKAASKESLQSQKLSVRSGHTQDSKRRHTRDTLSELYDKYEHLTGRSQRMSQIPESKVPEPKVPEANVPGRERHTKTPQMAISELESRFDQLEVNSSHLSPADSRSFSWKNVPPPNLVTPPWELSSAASISSRNTKTSRHTSTSAFSNSDLKNNSVLSLSSDSEEESSGPEPIGPHGILPNDRASRVLSGISTATPDSRRPSTRQSLAATSMTSITSKTYGSRRGSAQSHPSFTIPEFAESPLPNTRISGPCAQPEIDDHHSTRSQSSDRRQWRSSRKPSSTASRRSSTHPTPPISPTTVEFRDPSGRSSRYIAVTKQEEALLEALRQKRAHMREMIIEEHETAKSPPRERRRTSSRHAEVPFASTVRGPAGPKDRVLLYLDDAPMSKEHPIDTAEPSPDLSDFLTFASDEDSTPRTSWAPSRKGQHRPDSSISPRQRRSSKNSPVTPPAVRLSAVGATGGLKDVRSMDQGLGPKVRVPHGGVRLMDDGRLANPQDFLMDEEDEMGIPWGA